MYVSVIKKKTNITILALKLPSLSVNIVSGFPSIFLNPCFNASNNSVGCLEKIGITETYFVKISINNKPPISFSFRSGKKNKSI